MSALQPVSNNIALILSFSIYFAQARHQVCVTTGLVSTGAGMGIGSGWCCPAQSFTATGDGTGFIDQVDIRASGSCSLTIKIYEGLWGSNLVGESNLIKPKGCCGWSPYPLKNPVKLTTGQIYTIRPVESGSGCSWDVSSSDLYSGGKSGGYCPLGGCSPSRKEYIFQVYCELPPSPAPTPDPTSHPTLTPTLKPTLSPTPAPTSNPTPAPTLHPTLSPTSNPTPAPTSNPTPSPTFNPTPAPTLNPTTAPTIAPTIPPSMAPTIAPTSAPSLSPSTAPSNAPSFSPSDAPSLAPTTPPTLTPSISPSISPSLAPSITPSLAPSITPSLAPSISPSLSPSIAPSIAPSLTPSIAPSIAPSLAPSLTPSLAPSLAPTKAPSLAPTLAPTSNPTWTCHHGKYKYEMISSKVVNRYDFLYAGESFVSRNCRYRLIIKNNGRLMLKGLVGRFLDPYEKNELGNYIYDVSVRNNPDMLNYARWYDGWSPQLFKQFSNVSRTATTKLVLENRGLVVYEEKVKGVPAFAPLLLWKSNATNSNSYVNGVILRLTDDACLVLNQYGQSINKDTAIWYICSTFTAPKPDLITTTMDITSTDLTDVTLTGTNDGDTLSNNNKATFTNSTTTQWWLWVIFSTIILIGILMFMTWRWKKQQVATEYTPGISSTTLDIKSVQREISMTNNDDETTRQMELWMKETTYINGETEEHVDTQMQTINFQE